MSRVALIQAVRPDHVAKEFFLGGDGRLTKRAAAHITAGRYWSKPAATAAELAEILVSWWPACGFLFHSRFGGSPGRVSAHSSLFQWFRQSHECRLDRARTALGDPC